jgi:hypothetical protein
VSHLLLEVPVYPETSWIEEEELGTAGCRTDCPELTVKTFQPWLINRE